MVAKHCYFISLTQHNFLTITLNVPPLNKCRSGRLPRRPPYHYATADDVVVVTDLLESPLCKMKRSYGQTQQAAMVENYVQA